MPWIKQLFGIFYFKDLIYVKSYFQPYTMPCIVDYNIISQSSISSNNIIILEVQNSSSIGNILDGSGSRSSELLNRIAILEQELREANQNIDLNEQLNDETYILKENIRVLDYKLQENNNAKNIVVDELNNAENILMDLENILQEDDNLLHKLREKIERLNLANNELTELIEGLNQEKKDLLSAFELYDDELFQIDKDKGKL